VLRLIVTDLPELLGLPLRSNASDPSYNLILAPVRPSLLLVRCTNGVHGEKTVSTPPML